MTLECKLFLRTFEGSINSDIAIVVIDEFCQTIEKRTVIVIDNASIHRSNKFMAKIKEWKKLIYGYISCLHIRLWKLIKCKWLSFDAFINFQKFKERLNETLSLVGSERIINFY